MLEYHHCRPLESVVAGEVRQQREFAGDMRPAYEWLEQQLGFYPLFMAVGSTFTDIGMTGYRAQATANHALFSYQSVNGSYIDEAYWSSIGLSAFDSGTQPTAYESQLILKPSWADSKWRKKARESPSTVIMVTDSIDLLQADRVWVKNRDAKQYLKNMGFENVHQRSVRPREVWE